MIFKKISKILFLFSLSCLVFVPKKGFAQYYGGNNDNAQLILDKKLRWVPNGESMDNIDKNVKVFFENDMIEFSIMVRNTGNLVLDNIKLRDYLPEHISLMFYPGSFEADNNQISWEIDSLKPGEEKTYLIRGRIDGALNLNKDNYVQMTNKAEAKVDDISDNDTASYFVGGSSIPETGDASLLLKSLMVFSTASAGLVLRKYARGY